MSILNNSTTIPDKIFRTKSKILVKLDSTGKAWYLLLCTFDCYCHKCTSSKGGWALDYVSTQTSDFSSISQFHVSLKSFDSSRGNSFTKFVIPNIKFRFNCGKLDLYQSILKFQNIMTSIIDRNTSLSTLLCLNIIFRKWDNNIKQNGKGANYFSVLSQNISYLQIFHAVKSKIYMV